MSNGLAYLEARKQPQSHPEKGKTEGRKDREKGAARPRLSSLHVSLLPARPGHAGKLSLLVTEDQGRLLAVTICSSHTCRKLPQSMPYTCAGELGLGGGWSSISLPATLFDSQGLSVPEFEGTKRDPEFYFGCRRSPY